MIDNNEQNICQEFLMAIDVTSAGTPREKLLWAFRSSLNFFSFLFILGFQGTLC